MKATLLVVGAGTNQSSDVLHTVVAVRWLTELSLERPADDVSRAEADGKSCRKHDATEEDREGQQQYAAGDAEVIQGHGDSDEQHEPLGGEAEQPGRLDLHVDGA